MKSNLLSKELWNRDFILINLVCCIASYPNSILISVLPVYILDLGGSNTMTGFMMTGLTILTMATNIVMAPLIDKIGRKKLLVLGSGLFFLNTLLFCFTNNLALIFVFRVLCGFTTGVFFPVPPIIVADVSREEHLVDAVGIFGAAGSIAFAVTPTIALALYRHFSPTVMFISGAVMGGISFVITLFIEEHYISPKKTAATENTKKIPGLNKVLLPIMMMPMLINFIITFSNSPVNTFLTPCGLSRNLSQIGLYFIVNQGICIAARLLVGRTLEKISKKTCTSIGILLAAAGTSLIAAAYNMPLMFLSAVLVGIGYTIVTQIFQAESFSCVPSSHRGFAGTAFMLASSIGTGLGSSVWGVVSTGMGYSVTYILAGISALICFVFHRMHWRRMDT